MGNIRVSYFKNTNGSAEVLEENNFYPFGMKHEGYNQTAGNPSYNYQYSGKELQKETGWSDFGARMYMSDIARWGVIDPLAETTTRVNPYNYALNNPVMLIDPDGRKAFAPEAVEDNVPRGGLLDFYSRGGYESYASYNEFLGNGMPFFYKGSGSDGGGGGENGVNADNSDDVVSVYYEALSFLGVKQNSGKYFKGIDFSGYGNINDEEPVNFFGKSDKNVFHKKYEEMKGRLKNTEGDGVFRVYAHGNINMIWNGDNAIYNAADFDKAMIEKNKNWAKVDSYERPVLILFACLSATDVGNNGSIAKQISKAHPKVIAVGFRGFVEYDSSVKGIKRVNRQEGSGDGNGLIIIYKNGKPMHGFKYSEYLKRYKTFN
ncbi:RHS repeat-associated core domain-containing protein [Chryseobacterium mucoviscidosis]|uniref:RHS repeat domain-containing protein n=1 Tax=Chryseobacterium mucoviscidosis TaxID=1945581 RepID=UPI003018A34D